MKISLNLCLALLIAAPSIWADPIVTEIVAINTGGLEDREGSLSAWVEIYNPDPEPIDLIGMYATNDPDELTKHLMPRLQIDPEAYGILFLSGTGFSSLFNVEVHTSFKFSEGDDYFALVDSDGTTIVSALGDIQHRADASFGRLNPSDEELVLFGTPTPKVANQDAILGIVADTTFTVDRGFYTEPFTVEITSKTEGAQILYTTSGREPSKGTIFTGPIEHIYDGPITINETTVLRAKAFKDGYLSSNTDTQSYIFVADVVNQPDMSKTITESDLYGPQMIDALTSLPSISFAVEDLDDVTGGTSAGNDTEFLTSVELINPDGTKGFQVDAGVSRFGGYFTNFAKKSFRLYFRKRYGAAKLKYPLYRGFENGIAPAEEFDAINLRSGSHDMRRRGAYLSNRFTDDTLLDMGHIAPHGRFMHVYFNGVYWGQFHLRERWNAAMFASYFGGDEKDYDAINGNNTGSEFLPGDSFDGTDDYWDEALALSKGDTPFESVQNHIDLGSLFSFQLTWLSGQCESEFQSAGSRSQGVPFKFYFKDADGYLRPATQSINNRGPGDMMRAFRDEDSPEFRLLLADTIHKHYFNNGAFTAERNIARLKARIDETEKSFIAEAARWNGVNTSDYSTPAYWQGFQDNLVEDHFPDLTKDMIRKFTNAGWYPDNIIAPSFSQMGGEIESGFKLVLNAGTIFRPQKGDLVYTTDGTDPRLPGGARSASAMTFSLATPVILTETTTVKARTLDLDGQWSPLTEATFQTEKTPAPGDLIVSELHYRPEGPSAAEIEAGFVSRTDFEFIEFYNRSTETLDLSRVALVDGVRFEFADASVTSLVPGAVVVIVANIEAFTMRYGADLPIAGVFASGKLSNGGEDIRISLRDGAVIQELQYDNKEPWPEEADDSGKSLTFKDPTSLPALDDPEQWQASQTVGGTPGTLLDSAPPVTGSDNDQDGLPEFAEMALGSSDSDPTSGPDRVTLTEKADRWIVTVEKSAQATADQFQLETSSDLKTWTNDGFALDEEAAEALKWSSESKDSAQQYVRLKITAP
ncbi:MAG: hypothetical protein ACI9DF_002327 [Verrucomicrobiales bacterium]|jgi:hypothetical protein